MAKVGGVKTQPVGIPSLPQETKVSKKAGNYRGHPVHKASSKGNTVATELRSTKTQHRKIQTQKSRNVFQAIISDDKNIVKKGVKMVEDTAKGVYDAIKEAGKKFGQGFEVANEIASRVAQKTVKHAEQIARKIIGEDRIDRVADTLDQISGADTRREGITPEKIKNADVNQKVEWIEQLLEGATGNKDEQKILEILNSHGGKNRTAILEKLKENGKLNQLFRDIHGNEHDKLLNSVTDAWKQYIEQGKTKESISLLNSIPEEDKTKLNHLQMATETIRRSDIKDPSARQSLINLSTQPGFDQLSRNHQETMLNNLATDPTNREYANNLQNLAGNDRFRNLNDATKDQVLNLMHSNRGNATALANIRGLSTAEGFDQLSRNHQEQMLNQIQNHPIDTALSEDLAQISGNNNFRNLSDQHKTNLIAGLGAHTGFANANRVRDDLIRFSQTDSFKNCGDRDDQQRMLNMIGMLAREAHNGPGDQIIAQNTLTRINDGTYQLEMRTYNDPPGVITMGSASGNTLWLNRNAIPTGSGPMDPTTGENRAMLNTIAHEVNHLVNGNTQAGTFDRFKDEYRAWYVGFRCQYGREPTPAEARDRIQFLATDPNVNAYRHLHDAYDNNTNGMRDQVDNFLRRIDGDPAQGKAPDVTPIANDNGNNDLDN